LNYIDTSALAKWYVPETGSDAFGRWIAAQDEARISVLTRVEFRSMLARRQRNGDLGAAEVHEAWQRFLYDLEDGLFVVQPLRETHWSEAEALLDALPDLPLRTLDALHLACARIEMATEFATADRQLAAAARAVGMTTPAFD
jgi:predicted nucleic acid-binding protein